jgi:hypothetical protein
MRGRGLLVVAAGVAAAFFVEPAAADSPPPLSFELYSGSGSVYCAATHPRTITPAPSGQGCTIVQPQGGTAWCILKKSRSGPTPIDQSCVIRQTSTTRANVAFVVQIAEHRGGTSPQVAKQTAIVEQGNVTKSNNSFVTQVVRQALGRPLDDDGDYWGSWSFTASANQVQNARQLAQVCQGGVEECHSSAGMLSHNNSSVTQKQWQTEQAAASATINQEQNAALAEVCPATGEPANMCAGVDQNSSPSASGKNEEHLSQLYVQLQNARGKGTTVTDQTQGGASVFTGGLEHQIAQLGGGVASITTGQNSFQFQKAANVGPLTQKQDPRVSKDPLSTQVGAAGTTWNGKQRAFQFQLEDGALVTSVGGQRALLEYFAVTNGSIQADQFVNQNGQTDTNSCSASPCAAVLDCTNVEEGGLDLLSSIGILQAQFCVKDEPPPPPGPP